MRCISRMMMLTVMALAFAAQASAQTTQPGSAEPTVQNDTPDPANAQTPPPAPRPLTVAVLDFDTTGMAINQLGKLVGETITVLLAGEPGFEVVDRASLDKTLAEHELNLTGLVDNERAIEVGKLVGARILVTGRVFQLGDRLFITAKIIGTETTLVDGLLVRGENAAAIDELVLDLAQQLAQRLPETGPRLVAQDQAPDPLHALRQALAGRPLPRVAVVIREEHISGRPVPVPDPAVETEVKLMLRAAGVIVQDVPANALATWAPAAARGNTQPWPRELSNVDLVVTGEAFSEFAVQIGNLHSAAARVEINVIDRHTGQIVLAERATTRAVDLAEHIAGKSALEKGGRVVGLKLLHHLVETLPEPEADEQAPAPQ